jgi:glycosyltransferase involved in cell wall biosynthesis
MPRGRYPIEYFANPYISKPIFEIYRDLDDYTGEFFEEEKQLHHAIDFVIPVPPVLYEGRFIKGLFFSQAVEFLNSAFPQLKTFFVSMAHTMWTSYSWSESANAYLTCYHNPLREAWYRDTHPERASKSLIPLQDADYTNERRMRPLPVPALNIDILCISRLHAQKNVPMIARAIKVLRSKHPDRCIRMTLIAGRHGAYDPNRNSHVERGYLAEIEDILGLPGDYIDFVEHVSHFQLPSYYSRAGVFVLASLVEGKNRCLNEAMSCNTPVVCFQEQNQFARQGAPLFPEGAGLCAAFDPESLADAIYTVLQERESFRPRYNYLRNNGRRHFVNTCIDAIPYYRSALPNFVPGHHVANAWLDAAVFDNYEVSLHDFIYGRRIGLSMVKGIESIRALIENYLRRFQI